MPIPPAWNRLGRRMPRLRRRFLGGCSPSAVGAGGAWVWASVSAPPPSSTCVSGAPVGFFFRMDHLDANALGRLQVTQQDLRPWLARDALAPVGLGQGEGTDRRSGTGREGEESGCLAHLRLLLGHQIRLLKGEAAHRVEA